MAYVYPGEAALDYYPCRYGKSKILFRGPRRDLERPFVAVLGGTETYGKFLPLPYPALVEEATGLHMVNLGCVNAGLDVYLNEPVIPEILGRARVTVLQIMGAQNLSNRYYAVHPRRNDRFLRASSLLRTIYREVDFTEFNFTRHMLGALQEVSPAKFEVVVEELKAAWVARMSLLLDQVRGKSVLLWMGPKPPAPARQPSDLGQDPLFIDAGMLTAIRSRVSTYVEVVPSATARAAGRDGMAFSEIDAGAASGLPGPAVHREVAAALGQALVDLF
jgi:hypothetical protein